ncbi:MAG: hypothetical protein HQ523_03195 [Lentisphaerae bacterium]|nr:hypothetical protein [Lentisphaerota bacterium]
MPPTAFLMIDRSGSSKAVQDQHAEAGQGHGTEEGEEETVEREAGWADESYSTESFYY